MDKQFSDITIKLENFIKEKNIEAEHMLRTGFWMRKIFPETDETMYLAAICHDIERCFPLRDGEVKPRKTGDDKADGEYLAWHGQRSAEFTEKLLREFGFDGADAIARIKTLISEHSIGGTAERDLMMDADSISLFENNAELFIKEGKDKEKLHQKFESEFARLSSDRAKEFAKPFYDRVMKLVTMREA